MREQLKLSGSVYRRLKWFGLPQTEMVRFTADWNGSVYRRLKASKEENLTKYAEGPKMHV